MTKKAFWFALIATLLLAAFVLTRPAASAQDVQRSVQTAPSLTLAPGAAFTALGTPVNGTLVYCTDCAPVTPATCPATKASCVCAAGGVGSLAVRANALWYCPF